MHARITLSTWQRKTIPLVPPRHWRQGNRINPFLLFLNLVVRSLQYAWENRTGYNWVDTWGTCNFIFVFFFFKEIWTRQFFLPSLVPYHHECGINLSIRPSVNLTILFLINNSIGLSITLIFAQACDIHTRQKRKWKKTEENMKKAFSQFGDHSWRDVKIIVFWGIFLNKNK